MPKAVIIDRAHSMRAPHRSEHRGSDAIISMSKTLMTWTAKTRATEAINAHMCNLW